MSNITPHPVTEAMMNETITEASFLAVFSNWYNGHHGYISLIVSMFGIICNIVNIIVLLQKSMITPTNMLLVGIAIADICTMAVYVPYTSYFYLTHSLLDQAFPYGWVAYLLFSYAVMLTSHMVALWLTVSLAVFRYIVVCHHVHGPRLCNLYRAKFTIVIVTIVSIIICVPNYLVNKINDVRNMTGIPLKDNSSALYWMDSSELNDATNNALWRLQVWLYTVFFKIAPCIFLIVLSGLLIRQMKVANRRRMRLLSSRQRQDEEHSSEHNRTTNMLVAVVLMFVLAELPQGLIALWCVIDEEVFITVYSYLGDIFDGLVLVNSAVNFILYCIMSHQFRNMFTTLFLRKICCLRFKRKNVTSNGLNYSVTATTEVTHV